MSKRKLKKNINATIELLYSDCIFYKVFVIDSDKEAANKVLERIVNTHSDYVKRVSASEGKEVKGRVKAYYKKLEADFKNEIDAIAKEISNLP